jgi:uncharacterized protein YjiS (DUF1127 family)
MNACTALPAPIPLQRPLWKRAAEWVSEHLAAARAARPAAGIAMERMNLRSALTMNDHLLRDIGVSEALRDEVAARRVIESMAAHIAQHDFVQRGRHWYG